MPGSTKAITLAIPKDAQEKCADGKVLTKLRFPVLLKKDGEIVFLTITNDPQIKKIIVLYEK